MRPSFIISIFVIIGSLIANGQTTISPLRIVIHYEKGFDPWNDGEYSVGETFLFRERNDERFELISRASISRTRKGQEFLVDSTKVSFNTTLIESNITDQLRKELDTSRNNFSPEFIIAKLPKFSKHDILKTLRKLERTSPDEIYYDKDDRRDLVKTIQDCVDFSVYINGVRPLRVEDTHVTTDQWNVLSISFEFDSKTEKYLFDLDDLFGQPYRKLSCQGNEEGCSQQYINLMPNVLLDKILPENSLARKSINLNSVLERYLYWVIKRGF